MVKYFKTFFWKNPMMFGLTQEWLQQSTDSIFTIQWQISVLKCNWYFRGRVWNPSVIICREMCFKVKIFLFLEVFLKNIFKQKNNILNLVLKDTFFYQFKCPFKVRVTSAMTLLSILLSFWPQLSFETELNKQSYFHIVNTHLRQFIYLCRYWNLKINS